MKNLVTTGLLLMLVASCSSSDGDDDDPDAGAAGQGGSGGSGGSSSGTGGSAPIECDTPLCGGACCDQDSTCFTADAATGPTCGKRCEGGSECAPAAPCCLRLTDGSGVCAPESSASICLCLTSGDCESGSCAPYERGDGPVGPDQCVPKDGALYHGCGGSVSCDSDACCVMGLNGSSYCAPPCESDDECGVGKCFVNPLTTTGDPCGSWCDSDRSL